jgi:hypothetical protein
LEGVTEAPAPETAGGVAAWAWIRQTTDAISEATTVIRTMLENPSMACLTLVPSTAEKPVLQPASPFPRPRLHVPIDSGVRRRPSV